MKNSSRGVRCPGRLPVGLKFPLLFDERVDIVFSVKTTLQETC
jgi:hypothetical protein